MKSSVYQRATSMRCGSWLRPPRRRHLAPAGLFCGNHGDEAANVLDAQLCHGTVTTDTLSAMRADAPQPPVQMQSAGLDARPGCAYAGRKPGRRAMGNDAVLKAQVEATLKRVDALQNLTIEQTNAVVSIRADLNGIADAALVLAERVLELERQVSALQEAIRPRPV